MARACSGKPTNAYRALRVVEGQTLLSHGAEYDLECVDQVVEDDDAPLLPLGLGETTGVDDAHLLKDGRLAALSGSYTGNQNWGVRIALGGGAPSSSSFTSLSWRFRSRRSWRSISSFFRWSGSSFFFPKHIIPGAMNSA